MPKRLIYLLILLPILGCSKTTIRNNNNSALGIKIMSYNIHAANPPSKPADFRDLQAIADVITRVKPHLVALQEVDVYTKRSGTGIHQAKDLAALTGMNYFFVKAIDVLGGEYGVAILCRFPILGSKAIKLSLPKNSSGENRAAALITFQFNKQKMVFISTHIDHKSDENRSYQVNQLLNEIKEYEAYPMFIAGDLNMEPSNNIMDVFKNDFTIGCTTCPFTFSAIKPYIIIDYILINKQAQQKFNVLSYRTIDESYASDHLPLVADFSFKKKLY